jgi:hypothetical protein
MNTNYHLYEKAAAGSRIKCPCCRSSNGAASKVKEKAMVNRHNRRAAKRALKEAR